MEQALFLARIAKRVTIVHRGSTLRASKAMAARVLRHPKILVLWNTEIRRFVEDPDTKVLGSIEVETIVMDIARGGVS